ncbi:MAG: hypothetical protein PHW13_10690 [Methylococcales bacterium]|nr:hypothetical protein [Methylococcales bacterium]
MIEEKKWRTGWRPAENCSANPPVLIRDISTEGMQGLEQALQHA